MVDKEEKELKESNIKEKKSKKGLIIIIVVLFLAIAGGVTFFILSGNKKSDSKNEQEEKIEKVKNELLEFEPFVVNLAQANNFLRTTLLIEYNPKPLDNAEEENEGTEEGTEVEEESEEETSTEQNIVSISEVFKTRDPMIRDAIIGVLSSKTPEDILTSEGKATLKTELISAINGALGLEVSPVVSIYFKDFIMQ